MRNFAVRPADKPRGRYAVRAFVLALVVLAATTLGAGIALAAQGDVQCNGVLNGGTPNDPIGKVVSSPHDDPATTGVIEALPGDVITYTITWPPNGANKTTVLDCLVTDPVIGADGGLDSYGDAAADAALALVVISDSSGSLGALGTDLGFEKSLNTNPGTYTYSMTVPVALLGHSFANRAKVEGTNESKSNFLVVSVVEAPNVPPTVTCPTMTPDGLSVSYSATGLDTDGTITNYHWVFGDGQTADTATGSTSHTYASGGTYNVVVTVTDNDGDTGSSSGSCSVTVVAPPVPNLAPTVACPVMTPTGLSVAYVATGLDTDGTITNYHWVFGDGQTADTATGSTSHLYASDGTYNVVVSVTDDDGDTGSSSGACAVTVAAPVILPVPNQAPTVSCPVMSADGLDVTYTAAASDADGTIANYHWVFGDGQTADTATNSITHTYAAAGTNNVMVTVTDDDGDTGSSSGDCSITVAAEETPEGPPPADDDPPADDVPTVVLPTRRTLPRTGTDTTAIAWLSIALLFGGMLLRGVKPRPVRMVYAGQGLVSAQVAQYGLNIASNARSLRLHAFRRV